jgi:hypothetical protein
MTRAGLRLLFAVRISRSLAKALSVGDSVSLRHHTGLKTCLWKFSLIRCRIRSGASRSSAPPAPVKLGQTITAYYQADGGRGGEDAQLSGYAEFRACTD